MKLRSVKQQVLKLQSYGRAGRVLLPHINLINAWRKASNFIFCMQHKFHSLVHQVSIHIIQFRSYNFAPLSPSLEIRAAAWALKLKGDETISFRNMQFKLKIVFRQAFFRAIVTVAPIIFFVPPYSPINNNCTYWLGFKLKRQFHPFTSLWI